MVTMIAIPVIALSMLQASVAAPTDAFRTCLHDAGEKAKSDQVAGDKIDDFLRTSCTVQLGTFKDALVAFRIKTGMGRKAATEDASMTVDDYITTRADNYKFMLDAAAKNAKPAGPAASPQPQKP